MKGKTGGLNAAMKKFGRNVARAKNQTKGYAAGGAVKVPPAPMEMGGFGGPGMDDSGFGAGKARGGKSKGKKFGGTF